MLRWLFRLLRAWDDARALSRGRYQRRLARRFINGAILRQTRRLFR